MLAHWVLSDSNATITIHANSIGSCDRDLLIQS